MFNFQPPPGPQMTPFSPQQALAAFRPPPPMSMGGAPGQMAIPGQQQQPGMGGLQNGGFALAQALGQRPADPNANANLSGFAVGGGPQGPSGGAMASQGSGFWPAFNFLSPASASGGGGSASP